MIRVALNILFLMLFTIGGACQDSNAQKDMISASFPGGKNKLEKYLKDNMQWQQSQMTVAGKVFVSFMVEQDGELSNVKIIRGLCESCDKEAIRLVENMPKWKPAQKGGNKINSEQTITVKFEL